MNTQFINLGCIYQNHSVYDLMYGRRPYARYQEAFTISQLTEEARPQLVRDGELLRVAELFAGATTMQQELAAHSVLFQSDACVYTTQDGLHKRGLPQADLASEQVVAPDGATRYDLALLPFYSVNVIGPITKSAKDRLISVSPMNRANLDQLMRNVQTYLGIGTSNTKGKKRKKARTVGAYFDFEIQPNAEDMKELLEDDSIYTIVIPSVHPLLRDYMLDTAEYWVIRYRVIRTWDRLTSTLYDRFPDGVQVCRGESPKKPVLSFRIEHPMFRKYWSESELIEAARSVGFSEFRLYNAANRPILGGGYDFTIEPIYTTESADSVLEIDSFLPATSMMALAET